MTAKPLDDAALTRRLARLMGWEVYGPAMSDIPDPVPETYLYIDMKAVFWLRRPGPQGKVNTAPWRPLHDMNDAWMVVEHMQKEGYDYEIGSCIYSDEDGNPVEGHSVEFMRGLLDPYEGTHEETRGAIAPTPARAICLAALAALPKEGG